MNRNYRAPKDFGEELSEDLNGWGLLGLLIILGMAVILFFAG